MSGSDILSMKKEQQRITLAWLYCVFSGINGPSFFFAGKQPKNEVITFVYQVILIDNNKYVVASGSKANYSYCTIKKLVQVFSETNNRTPDDGGEEWDRDPEFLMHQELRIFNLM